MDWVTILVTFISIYSSCHGAYPSNDGYLPPPPECKDVTIDIASTMFVTETEFLPPFTNTRVLEPDTSFKAMAQHTTTSTITVPTLRPKHTITTHKYPEGCVTALPDVTVTNTIPVYTTKFLKPITITKASRMMVWMTVPPVTSTVLVTKTVKDEAKFKISVKTKFTEETVGPDRVEMTMPITFTELLAPMTSTVKDHNVHTTTLPAVTITEPGETYMPPPTTVTSTVIITHTEVIPPDTKMVTWTVTQMVNKKCSKTYMYNEPKVPFPPPAPLVVQKIAQTAVPQVPFTVQSAVPQVPFTVQSVQTKSVGSVNGETLFTDDNGENTGDLPAPLINVLKSRNTGK